MGAEIPKQYLPLAGKRVIEHSLERLCVHPLIAGVFVVVAPHDPWWKEINVATTSPPRRVEGGAERCHSVLHGLEALAAEAHEQDWVLIHDAARPCIHPADVNRLILELSDHAVGGLLGRPVRDTMKRTNAHGDVVDTLSREGLWHALTPQMFRVGALTQALRDVIDSGRLVTDEAQAMELAGAKPRVIEGRSDNIKITWPEDMALADLFIRRQAARGDRP